MARRVEIAAVARLELAEVVRSRWLGFAIAVYLALAGIFVLAGLRESTVIGFTGMGRVLLSFAHALVLLLPLVGLSATGQVVGAAREQGTLELLLSLPLSRSGWFAAVSLVRYLVLLLPLLVLMPAMALWGSVAFAQPMPWGFLLRALAVSASLLACAVGAGLLVSSHARSPARALIAVLALWAAVVALLDFALIGLMLQMRLRPELVLLLAGLNPVQSARMALLSAAEPELATLGPVGFFLAHRIGADWLLVLGVGWPLLLGLGAWSLALRRLERADVV
ncbi:MAG: hypothetical protein KatS3mg102_2636 [Planctomycetota bacterium]|nr:MAG: hypothetical protein KatS3mg102_2636 [Planctomycetota bacterium]